MSRLIVRACRLLCTLSDATSTAAFDATDQAELGQFFAGLPTQVDHVMVTGPGPYYAPLAELDH